MTPVRHVYCPRCRNAFETRLPSPVPPSACPVCPGGEVPVRRDLRHVPKMDEAARAAGARIIADYEAAQKREAQP